MSAPGSSTTGIDLAAQDGSTAICHITWSNDTASVHSPVVHVSDDDVLAIVRDIPTGQRVGVDCPFGWPERFVRALGAHQDFDDWPDRGALGDDSRRTLRYRRTDLNVKELCGITPLSVSSDWIAVVAMRWAGLLDAVAVGQQGPVDRSGGGSIVEVYPAAALKRWSLPYRGYKGDVDDEKRRALRLKILSGLEQRVRPKLALDTGTRHRLVSDHNALDALVCALIARAVAVNAVEAIPPEDANAAAREGWIAVPDGHALERLGG